MEKKKSERQLNRRVNDDVAWEIKHFVLKWFDFISFRCRIVLLVRSFVCYSFYGCFQWPIFAYAKLNNSRLVKVIATRNEGFSRFSQTFFLLFHIFPSVFHQRFLFYFWIFPLFSWMETLLCWVHAISSCRLFSRPHKFVQFCVVSYFVIWRKNFAVNKQPIFYFFFSRHFVMVQLLQQFDVFLYFGIFSLLCTLEIITQTSSPQNWNRLPELRWKLFLCKPLSFDGFSLFLSCSLLRWRSESYGTVECRLSAKKTEASNGRAFELVCFVLFSFLFSVCLFFLFFVWQMLFEKSIVSRFD